MKLASLSIILSFGLLAGACQNTSQTGVNLTASPTPILESTLTRPPVTITAESTTNPSNEPATPAARDTPTARPTMVEETPSPSPTEIIGKLPTSTPPSIADGLPTPPTAVPTAVAPITAAPSVTNIILAGNDVQWPQGGRTDALIIVSIDRETKKAALISLPRDLYVYIPGWTMNRINLALPHGHGVDYPGGGGGLLADTIEYNFGLHIDHYVRIGFGVFKEFIDTLDGVEVVVNCSLTDWRLKEPDLEPTVEENWERYTLVPGLHQMDGDLALWYARSRQSTNDFDRGRRQQQLVQAMLVKGVSLDLVDDVPELWDTYRENIETDLRLPEIIALAALGPAVNDNGVQHLLLPANAFKAWRVPITGEAVQLPQWEAAQDTFEQLVQPPLLNRGNRPPLTVEVVTDDDVFFRQAAENLNWHGIRAVQKTGQGPPPLKTRISYNQATLKGSFHWLVAWLFGLQPEDVALNKNSDSPYDYQVILGRDFNPCLSSLTP